MSNSKKVVKHTCVGCQRVKPDSYGSWMGRLFHFWVCFECQRSGNHPEEHS